MKSKPHQCLSIVLLTTGHIWNDDRIYHKEAISLARAGYEVIVVAQADGPDTVDSIRVIPLPESRSRFVRYAVNPLWCLWFALRNPSDVYHIHDPELLVIATILRVFGKQVIYDAHEDYQEKLKSKGWRGRLLSALWRPWESFASRLMSHNIVADSHTLHRFPKAKTTIIANFVPLHFADVATRVVSDDTFRIVYVGGLSYERGIGKAIEALDVISIPRVELHLAGSISESSLADAITKHPKVIYHGLVPWSDVNVILAQADIGLVLLQPTPAYLYCPGENCVKLFEYMLLGLPVLISNFPKLKELIEALDVGMAVDPTSPGEIAKAIEYLAQNPAVRKRMGDNGRNAVREHYNWEHESTKLLAVYERILPKTGNALKGD